MKSGIYFGMHEDEYHSVHALGSSNIKQLLMNPVGYWATTAIGKQVLIDTGVAKETDSDDTTSKIFGRAAHTIVLEPDRFDDLYIERKPMPSHYLGTKEQMREAIEDKGGQSLPRGASRSDLARAAKMCGLSISDDWQTDFIIEAAGREVLSDVWMARLRLIAHLMDTPRADIDGQSIRQNTMPDGAPEVSVFWEEDGIPMKARFDWLRWMGAVDVKTYGARDDANPIEFFLSSVARYGYDLQRAHYEHGWKRIPDFVKSGAVFNATPADMAMLEKIKPDAPMYWRWLAIKTTGMPEIDRIDFEQGAVLESARIQRAQAVETYRRYYEAFGLEQPWVSTRGRIVADDDTFRATRLELRMTARGEETWNAQ